MPMSNGRENRMKIEDAHESLLGQRCHSNFLWVAKAQCWYQQEKKLFAATFFVHKYLILLATFFVRKYLILLQKLLLPMKKLLHTAICCKKFCSNI